MLPGIMLAGRVGAPTSLAALGLPEQALPHVAATVAASAVPNPRPAPENDLVDLLRAAYVGKQPATPEMRHP